MTVFPDTNFLLHYPRIREVDWQALCNAKAVTVVLCLQVIHELDEKKDHSFLSERARNVIKDIKEIKRADGLVKKDVTLRIFNYELRSEEFPQTLSPDSGDDKIIHLVKKYQEKNKGEDIVILTEDLGMQLRCEANGLNFIEPDTSIRLPSPKSEVEKKHQKTLEELNALKNRLPKIKVILSKRKDECEIDEVTPLTIEDLPGAVSLLDIDKEIGKERERLSWKPSLHHDTKQIVATQFNLAHYQERLKGYLEDYRNWIEAYNNAQPILSMAFDFFVIIKNIGTMPSEDLNVILAFPSLFEYVACKNQVLGKLPRVSCKPTPPKQDESIFSGIFNQPSVLNSHRMPEIITRHDPSMCFEKCQGDMFRANFHVPKLKHHCEIESFHIHAAFKSLELIRSFNVGVEVIDKYMPHKEIYEIPVKVIPYWEDKTE